MSLPFTILPLAPADLDSPGLGAADLRLLAQLFIDIFGIPAATPISGSLMALGANTDGRLSLLPVVKAATPYQRLIGTEPTGADVRLVEDTGLVSLDKNTAADPVTTWLKLWGFDVSAATFLAKFTQANTALRTYTLPDKDGVVAMLSDAATFPSGTVMSFFQAAAPIGWTRVVDAGNTDAVVRLLLNGEVPSAGGSWTISGLTVVLGTHAHEAPEDQYPGSGEEHIEDAFFPASGHNRTFHRVGVSTDLGTVSKATVNTGTVDLGTKSIASTGAWRPKHRDCILASKD